MTTATNRSTPAPHDTGSPALPAARGPLSESVIGVLVGSGLRLPDAAAIRRADPYGDDLHLLLYVLYELHYRGFAGVDERLEWDPALLGVRGAAEDLFLDAVRRDGGSGGDDVAGAVDALQLEPVGDDGHGVSHHLQREGELWQLREYAAVRSLYHLKEADPHLWVDSPAARTGQGGDGGGGVRRVRRGPGRGRPRPALRRPHGRPRP
ncbi:iron-containing redox enzyme family protein [Streptomyces californicus]